MKKIIINNLLISFTEFKGEANQTLLFLHGWRSSKEVWNEVIKNITSPARIAPQSVAGRPSPSYNKEGNYSVYAIDLPGFGGSSLTPPLPSPSLLRQGYGGQARGGNSAGMSVGDYAEVVKGFIEKLELKNVIIVGHSFGGRVGIKLASKYPGIICKLVLVDSAGFAIRSSRKNLMGIVAKLVKPFFLPKFMQGLRRKIYKFIGADDYVTLA